MIEIYILEALVAFQEYGTLSSAAEHLHITQPALSRSMKKLEDTIGVPLFERTKNKISLTESGKIAAMYAQRILQSEDEMITLVRNHYNSLHTIAVGYCTPGPMMEIPSILSRSFPSMTVSSEMMDEEDLIKGLRNESFTMVIISQPPSDEDIITIPYGHEQLYISAIPAHPLSVYKDQGVSFEDVNGETFIQASEVGTWDRIKKKMMPDSKVITQSNMDTLNELINSSSLLGFASDLTVRLFRNEANPNRIFIPINDPEATITYYCAFLKRNKNKLQDLISLLTNHNLY